MQFGEELQSMVVIGAVTASSVRLWCRAVGTGPYRLIIEPVGSPPITVDIEIRDGSADHTGAWTYPDEFPGASRLAPTTAHELRIADHDGSVVGCGRFTTAPESANAPHAFTFAAMSCHQPFDNKGELSERSRSMLRVAHEAMTVRGAQFFLAMGDQVYSDAPPAHSLFDESYFQRVAPPGRASLLECTRGEIRALFQQRYRQFWAIPELQRLYAEFPSWPMLDDHEIVDNFGSLEEHALPPWDSVREGALDAFHDYQGSRVLAATPADRPRSFDHGFRWGTTAVYQIDNRSERRAYAEHTQVVTPAQLSTFSEFLRAHDDARLLIIMVPVPLVFVPSRLANLAGALTHHEGIERWSHERCRPDRDRIFRLLVEHARAHPAQKLLLLSGDIHAGTAFQIKWTEGLVFHQLTASALTNKESFVTTFLTELAPRTVSSLSCGDLEAEVSLVAAADGAPAQNPFGRLNLGFVHVDDDGHRTRVQLELVSASDDERPIPVTAYLSPWLTVS